MKIFCNFLLILIIMSVSASAEEPRMPDTTKIVKRLMEIPEYQPYLVPGTDQEATEDQYVGSASWIFIPQEHIAYGSFYNQNSNIDMIEEYCLAAFMLNRKLDTANLQNAFNEEFPRNAEGYHRMAALWYKTYAINPNYNETAKDAIPLIVKHGQKYGIAITEESARAYYLKAVRNSLNSAFTSELSKAGLKPDTASLEKIIAPWFEYFTNPSTENFFIITTGRICIEDISLKNKSKSGLLKTYDNAVTKFAGDAFFIHWSYSSSRSSLYDEDIARINKEYFKNIPVFGQ